MRTSAPSDLLQHRYSLFIVREGAKTQKSPAPRATITAQYLESLRNSAAVPRPSSTLSDI